MGRFLKNRGDDTTNLSIGDLMAGLLFIFVLILSLTLIRLESIADEYFDTKQDIADALRTEFSDDFEEWGASLDEGKLSIVFLDERGLFEPYSAVVSERLKEIMADFFPRFVQILISEHSDDVEEIRIEGHSAPILGTPEEYVSVGLSLSVDRPRNTLSDAIFWQHIAPLPIEDVEWLRARISVAGYSNGRPELNGDGSTDINRSRRIEFRVLTNAEATIAEIVGANSTRR